MISDHRLARLTAWARLWLVWFAGVFAAVSPARVDARRRLAQARGVAARLIVLTAAQRMPAPLKRGVHRHGRLKRRGALRAAAGSALRRAMRGPDPLSRLAAVLAVMRDAERHVARLVRRLRRGLTRRRAAPAAAAPCAILQQIAALPDLSPDTS